MNNSILEITLPNQKTIFYLNIEEVEYLYAQMPNYLKHGITLEQEDVVFDVGANIGMFSLMCSHLCNNKLDIYAFEPVPQIF
ncbi:MAG: methyltransferase, partial [Cyanobacteria bacterium J06600_6]